ncbi:MAG: hypothetical protein CM1200mP41_36660 [Gammaproteobacteria bacterium]|nr:MAG: hypothetical protein CM1200mP41_36660 [Gammaproteobacteria bacterium]
MAWVLGIPQLVILTGVSGVSINFGRIRRKIGRIGVTALRGYRMVVISQQAAWGQKLKPHCACRERRIACDYYWPGRGVPALAGETGTHVVPDEAL